MLSSSGKIVERMNSIKELTNIRRTLLGLVELHRPFLKKKISPSSNGFRSTEAVLASALHHFLRLFLKLHFHFSLQFLEIIVLSQTYKNEVADWN